MDELEFFKDNYFDSTETIRHYDSQRATFARTLLAAVAIVWTAGVYLSRSDLFSLTSVMTVFAFQVVLSIIGLFVMIRFEGLIQFQRERAKASYYHIDKVLSEGSVAEIDRKARVETTSKTSLLQRLPLGKMWRLIWGVLALFGMIGLVMSWYA
jgi:hypothetical protein